MAKKTLKTAWLISSLIIVSGLLFSFKVQAATTQLHIDEATIIKGYTVNHQNGDFLFAVTPNQVDQTVTVELQNIAQGNRPLPAGKIAVSDFFQHDMLGDHSNPIIVKKPSYLAIRYSSDNNQPKYLYIWDRNKNSWSQMPSSIDAERRYVRGLTHLPFGQAVILENEAQIYEGIASWFNSPRNDGAACNHFPFNTRLKITDLSSGKTTEVVVIDRGPFVAGRIIDLDTEAFKVLAPLGTGLINVRIEPIGGTTTEGQQEDLEISSAAAIVVNEKTGQVLWEKNSTTIRPVASLTKIMTAYIFLQSGTPWDKVMTYNTGYNTIGARLYLNAGDQLTTKDLFYSMLVGSANNAALLLADSTGLSRDDFVARMNTQAQEWGLTQTTFVDPSGLDPANQSTAAEYAILARHALGSLTMLQGTTTKQYSFTTINTRQVHNLRATNKLLDSDLYITGTKTGYLDEALYCLMARARNNQDQTAIAVVLGAADSTTRYNETERLLNWGLDQLAN